MTQELMKEVLKICEMEFDTVTEQSSKNKDDADIEEEEGMILLTTRMLK